jgi:ankyrin repeat protein
LHEAALLGRRDLVDALLAAGAELDSRADDGRTPLSEARRRKHEALVRYLVGKGARGPELAADLTAPPKD